MYDLLLIFIAKLLIGGKQPSKFIISGVEIGGWDIKNFSQFLILLTTIWQNQASPSLVNHDGCLTNTIIDIDCKVLFYIDFY